MGYEVSLETSGALSLAEVDSRVVKVMDLKTPASGEVEKNLYDNIQYLGELTQEDKIHYLRTAKATILPYTPDAHSLVLIESMLCGTPVIALNNGAFQELNIHGRTGFNMNKPEQIKHAIKNIDMISRKDVVDYAWDRFSFLSVMPKYIDTAKAVSEGYTW